MTLLNDPASVPSEMWAVVRLLVAAARPLPVEDARALLAPPSLLSEKAAEQDRTFDHAVHTLGELGLVAVESDHIRMLGDLQRLTVDDLAGFTDLMRSAVLDPARNEGVGDSGEQTGPRDLVRALAWFLCGDPFRPLGWRSEVERLQQGAFPARVGTSPFVNDFRWGRFLYWAPALGFAAAPAALRSETRGQKLVCDCTAAVRRTLIQRWPKGEWVDAREAVAGILDDLPVLPGGRYSRELDLPQPSDTVSASLSFALLCGEDQGWIALDRRSDSPQDVLLVDPDQAGGTQRVTDLVVQGGVDG